MVNIPRVHCHSAFKHYEMYHMNCGGSDTYNTTFNFNGGSIFGGGFMGGLWSGVGMGLGAGLMNLFGFGGGGCFGGGMSMFGGWGFPSVSNWWGGSGSGNGAGGAGNSSYTGGNTNIGGNTYNNYNTKAAKPENNKQDNKALTKYKKRYDKLSNEKAWEKNPTKEAANLRTLYKELIGWSPANEVEEPNDNRRKEAMLKGLQDIASKHGINLDDIEKPKSADPNKKISETNNPTKDAKVIANPEDQEVSTVPTQDAEDESEDSDGLPTTDELNGLDAEELTALKQQHPELAEIIDKIFAERDAEEAQRKAKEAEKQAEANKAISPSEEEKIKPEAKDTCNDALKNIKMQNKGNEMKNATIDDLKGLGIGAGKGISIIDTSSRITDFINRVVKHVDNDEKVITVVVTNSGAEIRYKLSPEKDETTGALKFISNKDQQEYLLQKDENDNIFFMQYEWNKGYDRGDLRDDTKDNNSFGI